MQSEVQMNILLTFMQKKLKYVPVSISDSSSDESVIPSFRDFDLKTYKIVLIKELGAKSRWRWRADL